MNVARVYNFNPGPATLPLPVLEEAQKYLLDYNGTGMSVLEISHRSKEYEAINQETEALLKEIMDIPEDYRVLFMQGGASTQFAMVPANFLAPGKVANYVITGSFAQKAYKEAAIVGEAHVACTTKDSNHSRIPAPAEIKLSQAPAYVHITSNNTIFGTQWQDFRGLEFKDPDTGAPIPLVADMSSDILSRRFDVSQFGLIYAGAQKNLGPAGVTVVIIRSDLIEASSKNEKLPVIWRYSTYAENNSLYNTPPVFAVYLVNLVLKWVKAQGGLDAIEAVNRRKAALLYQVLDANQGFYRPHAQKDSRSIMNVTFRLPSEDLEKEFVRQATEQGLVGLKGHRSVGGIRASIYNAMPIEGCQALAQFMQDFARRA